MKFRQRSDTHHFTISYEPAQFHLETFQDHSDHELTLFLKDECVRKHHAPQAKPARAVFCIVENNPQVQVVPREDVPHMYNRFQPVDIHTFPLFQAYPHFTQVSVCFIHTPIIKEWDVSRFKGHRPAFTTAGQVESRDEVDMGWLESEIDDMIAT
jgi:hypothetical protein